ncbi:MAG: M20 family metallopeptidase [Planctomycetaceae bacterium]
MTDPLPLLKDLVSIPSVNPMGRDVSGPEFYEGRVTAYLENYLSRLNVPFEIVELASGRANVLARLDGNKSSRTILLDAHQDTVPVDGMTIPPFEPTEKEGRVYGRGSCDVKGGMASMLAAFTRLATERPAGMANVVLSCSCDEEATSIGINHLAASWTGKATPYRLCPKGPDVAIVAEPTELNIVVAHRGATRWKLRTAGRACHSSRPSEGVNAIYRMARVLQLLEEYAAWLPGSRPAHPLCGPATLSVGLISGGSSVNVVPDGCVIELDRRVIPGEENLAVQTEIANYLRERLDFELVHEAPYCTSPALGDDLNGSLAQQLGQTISSVVGPRQIIGVPYGTHASRLARIGIPSVVFGPGNIGQAHTKDEWIAIDQLRQAADVYFQFCAAG